MGAEPGEWTGLEPEHKVALKLKMHTKCSSKSNMRVILRKNMYKDWIICIFILIEKNVCLADK